MVKEYCDICGYEFKDDLFSDDVKILITTESVAWKDKSAPLTLCKGCSETLFYFLRNPALLKKHVNEMRLANRVRFLFGWKIKEEA